MEQLKAMGFWNDCQDYLRNMRKLREAKVDREDLALLCFLCVLTGDRKLLNVTMIILQLNSMWINCNNVIGALKWRGNNGTAYSIFSTKLHFCLIRSVSLKAPKINSQGCFKLWPTCEQELSLKRNKLQFMSYKTVKSLNCCRFVVSLNSLSQRGVNDLIFFEKCFKKIWRNS